MLGLFSYPVLMAADILLYRWVPIGIHSQPLSYIQYVFFASCDSVCIVLYSIVLNTIVLYCMYVCYCIVHKYNGIVFYVYYCTHCTVLCIVCIVCIVLWSKVVRFTALTGEGRDRNQPQLRLEPRTCALLWSFSHRCIDSTSDHSLCLSLCTGNGQAALLQLLEGSGE